MPLNEAGRRATDSSSGKWGPIPMPANKVSDDEAKKLVAWILSL